MDTKRHLEELRGDHDLSPKKQRVEATDEADVKTAVLSDSKGLHENDCGQSATDVDKSVSIAAESIQTGKPEASENVEISPVVHEVPASSTTGEPVQANGERSSDATSNEKSKPDDVMLDAPEQDGALRIALNKIVDTTLVNFKPFDGDLFKQLKSVDTILKMLSSLFKSKNLITLSSPDDVKRLAAVLIQLNDKSRCIDQLLIQLTDEIRALRSHSLTLVKQLQNPNEPKTKELQQLIVDCEKKSVSDLDDAFKLLKALLIGKLLKTDSLADMDGKTTHSLFELLILHLSTIFLLSTDSATTTTTTTTAVASISPDGPTN